ncbi:Hsp20/alpha crystallin family protein [Marinithermus hydrothermalis]|uniref:Heat shock protein Hsp20 n=1 Tax=Marinithermus hydrothermalis (strain DSM 14884 / JCM 11576 / T1) TaxID=869210 RepID=F2NNI1_MARHT|nr:Hsp20/alpha crystallin family protein [Marinithermus hydrothermalis]AEB10791.1 heat shock protein Hsp20 [Marinithermus hydrothermalis DSM 14884]
MALVKRNLSRPTELTPFRTWDPFNLIDEVNRLFDEAFGEPMRAGTLAGYAAPADLYETDEALILEMAVPGINPDDIEVSIEGNKLMIRGEAGPASDASVRRYYLQELAHGSFARAFTLPVEINADEAKAEFKNGILKLTLPKVAEARAKRVPIQVSQ